MTFSINTGWTDEQVDLFKQFNQLYRDDVSHEILEEAAETATVVLLSLNIDGHSITRMLDSDHRLNEGPRGSAYRFAEWLIWNWWRIRWEPQHNSSKDIGWSQAHETASIGGGWLWPRVVFESDGNTIAIHSEHSDYSQTEPVSYIGDEERFVPAVEFESAVDEFLSATTDRLADESSSFDGLQNVPLHDMWRQLVEERRNPKLANYRRIEALLGYNPDEGPTDRIRQLSEDINVFGESAINEIAAHAPLMKNYVTAADLVAISRSSGFEIESGINSESALASYASIQDDNQDKEGSVAPWRIGAEEARKFCFDQRTVGEPISDESLCEYFGVRSSSLNDTTRMPAPIAFTLSDKQELHRYVVFRSKVRTGRRFEMARLLGDRLMIASREPLQPATSTRTFRQKIQRAFAAELLCPFDSLQDVINEEYTAESVEKAARHFDVSPVLVSNQLQNHGIHVLD